MGAMEPCGLRWASHAATLRRHIQRAEVGFSGLHGVRVEHTKIQTTETVDSKSASSVTCAVWHNGEKLGVQTCGRMNSGAACIQGYLSNGDLTQVCDGSNGEGAFPETASICKLHGYPAACCEAPAYNGFSGLKILCLGLYGSFLDAPNASNFVSCSPCEAKVFEDSIGMAPVSYSPLLAIAASLLSGCLPSD